MNKYFEYYYVYEYAQKIAYIEMFNSLDRKLIGFCIPCPKSLVLILLSSLLPLHTRLPYSTAHLFPSLLLIVVMIREMMLTSILMLHAVVLLTSILMLHAVVLPTHTTINWYLISIFIRVVLIWYSLEIAANFPPLFQLMLISGPPVLLLDVSSLKLVNFIFI